MEGNSQRSNGEPTDLETTFMEITGSDKARAKVVLGATGFDLQDALNLYWEVEETKGKMDAIGNGSKAVVQEEVLEEPPRLEISKTISADESTKLQQVIEESLIDHKSKEPSVDYMFEVLISNYSQKDPETMKKLCMEYEGKSADLEKYIEQNFEDIPTKQQAANRDLKAMLEDDVSMLQKAGVEGLKVESCPSCWTAKIIEDLETPVFCCPSSDCGLEYCRKCWNVQHEPEPCRKVRKGDMSKTETAKTSEVDFEVVNILPKRQFDENDPMEVDYRIAEGQFLRMQAKGINTRLSIQSIDVVTNKPLEKRFLSKKNELKEKGFSDCLLLFHGTPQTNVESILKNNFDTSIIANGRAYGNGVYFSECPEVSIGYSTVGKKLKQQQQQGQVKLVSERELKATTSLILCKVLLGDNSKEQKKGVGKKASAKDERCWAIVVPNVDQILPKYVINFN